MFLLARNICPIRAKAHFLGLSVIVSTYYQCSEKGDKCRVGSRRLHFRTSVSHFGACALRFYTSLLHFGAEWVDPEKTFRQGRPPKIIGEKNRKISQFLLSLNFPISLAKSSFSSLESSKSEVNQSFKFRPSDLFKSVSFSVLSSGVFFPFWIAYIIQIF